MHITSKGGGLAFLTFGPPSGNQTVSPALPSRAIPDARRTIAPNNSSVAIVYYRPSRYGIDAVTDTASENSETMTPCVPKPTPPLELSELQKPQSWEQPLGPRGASPPTPQSRARAGATPRPFGNSRDNKVEKRPVETTVNGAPLALGQ